MLGTTLTLAALSATTPASNAPLDFVSEALVLSGVAACAPGGARPVDFDETVVNMHCRLLAALQRRWRHDWLERAQPFLERVVPADLPARVVYPFGGGDLLTALISFPRASEIDTLSLEPAGDARAIDTLLPENLPGALADVRSMAGSLFAVAHSKTSSMAMMAHRHLPGELTSELVALAMNDLDPVSLKYFQVRPDGALHYVSAADIAAAGDKAARARLFANVEIVCRPAGGGHLRVFRHFAANLDDQHLRADPSVLRHLEAKGRVAAITKAASYLLWWDGFSQIRSYLLAHMVWMISDSTGIPVAVARPAGFEQIPYGHFEGPFLGHGRRHADDFHKLWLDGAKPLSFRFGYPDRVGNAHLLVTRLATTPPSVAQARTK